MSTTIYIKNSTTLSYIEIYIFIMYAVVMCTFYFAFQMRELRAFSLSCLYDGFRPNISQTTVDMFVSSLCFNAPSIRDPLYCADTVNLYKIRPTSSWTRLKRPIGKYNRKWSIPVERIWTYRGFSVNLKYKRRHFVWPTVAFLRYLSVRMSWYPVSPSTVGFIVKVYKMKFNFVEC